MTDEAKALVERLRDDLPQTLIEKHWVDDHDAIYKQREEAADLIETQAREIERLREDAARYHWIRGRYSPPNNLFIHVPDEFDGEFEAFIDAVRAALGESHD